MSSSATRTVPIRRGTNEATNALGHTAVLPLFEQRSTTMNAADRAEAEYRAAIESGYNAGLENARAEVQAAMDDANKKVRRALAALCEAVDAFDDRQTIALREVEDEIVASAFEIATAIIQRELAVAADPGAEAIARAMCLAPNRGDVIARLNPGDVETLSMERISTSGRTIEIVADPAVEPGGCLLDIAETRVDAQLGTAIAHVREALALSPTESMVAGSNHRPSRTTSAEAPNQ